MFQNCTPAQALLDKPKVISINTGFDSELLGWAYQGQTRAWRTTMTILQIQGARVFLGLAPPVITGEVSLFGKP